MAALLFPEKCPFCRSLLSIGAEDIPGLCPPCAQDIQWIRPPFCPRCGRPFQRGTDSHLCSDCLRQKHFFDWGRAAVCYQGVMAEAIQRFKYKGDINLADPLGWFWNPIPLEGLSFEAIIPVPLHPSRLRERGFNQALLLGKILGRIHQKKVLAKGLRRIRNTVPQVQLDHSQREKNVRGAFVVRKPQEIIDKGLLLVDDVFTTGATVNECAKVLKKTGAREVFVLTLARVGVE
ncbi:MAG: amidophosphoribosyltransferase [Desulfobacca sp.]|nr:amidophosphoribosyltransferase [Desulfobacca sp.]